MPLKIKILLVTVIGILSATCTTTDYPCLHLNSNMSFVCLENRIPSHQRQQQPRSRQNTSGGGFHVENLTNADLAELKYFSSILDRAAAKGKLSRISPTATAEPTSNKHSPSNSKGANFAGQSTFQPVSSNTSSKGHSLNP